MIRCSKGAVSNIPKSWKALQLKNFVNLTAGGKLDLTKSNYVDEGIPAFSASGQDGFVNVVEHSGTGVVLSAIGARCGKAFYAEGQWSLMANTYMLQANPEVMSDRYLWELVNDEQYWYRSGTAQPFIKPRDMEEAWVPVPPLKEQRLILSALDKIAVQKQRKADQLLFIQQLYRGFLQRLKAGGFFSNASKLPIRDVCSVGMGETLIAEHMTGSGIPVFSAGTQPKPWAWTSNNKKRYERGTVIVSARGTIGAPRLPDYDQYTSTQTTLYVKPKELDPLFLWGWLKTLDFRPISSTQAIPMLTVSSMGGVRIPIPSVAEQEWVAKQIQMFENLKKNIQKQMDLCDVLKTGMKSQLLYGIKRMA